MGIGKTTVCRLMKRKLDRAVFLDGDWCWDADPFTVTEETKKIVNDNICHILNNFLGCSEYQNIIFCWVMHKQEIIDNLLSRLDISDCNVKIISLVCTPEQLISRLEGDIMAGIRTQDIIDRSVSRLHMYEKLDSIKIDVTNLSPFQTMESILAV